MRLFLALTLLSACTSEPAAPAPASDSGALGVDAGSTPPGDSGPVGVDTGSPVVEDSGAPLDATPADAPPPAEGCPPTGPFGTGAGSVVADAVVYDCDGNPIQLHSLCENEVSWISVYADWCPPCRGFARDEMNGMEAVWQQYQNRIGALVILSEDMSYNAATQELCNEVAGRYPHLSLQLAFDPDGSAISALGLSRNAENIVLRRGMVVEWEDKYADDEVASRLDAALAP